MIKRFGGIQDECFQTSPNQSARDRGERMKEKIERAIGIAVSYGQIDGDHHKTWVIDQMVRALLGSDDEYKKFIKEYCDGEDGEETYYWDEGIAP